MNIRQSLICRASSLVTRKRQVKRDSRGRSPALQGEAALNREEGGMWWGEGSQQRFNCPFQESTRKPRGSEKW